MSKLPGNRSLIDANAARTRRRRSELKGEVALAAIAGLALPNDLLPDLKVTLWPVEKLRPPTRNARKIEPEHLAQVADALKTYGFVQPLLVVADASGAGAEIIDGVTRLAAAKALGLQEIPCIVLRIPRSQALALRLRINREQEKGSWDLKLLGEVLIELDALEIDLGITGFEVPEIDLAMNANDASDLAREERPLPAASGPPVTRPGDVYVLDDHRLICGDALKPETYQRLLGGVRVAAIVSDPPYNQPASRIGGRGRVRHADFEQAAGELSDEGFLTFCRSFIALMIGFALPGAYVYLFMDWMHLTTLTEAARLEGLEQKNLIVWDKGHGGMGGLYRSGHELIPLFVVPGAEPINHVQLGRFGRDRTNIFRYPGANTLGSSARGELANHPTPKNVECIGDMLLDVTAPGDAVLDSFVGSGTIFIAAERTRRRAYGIELSPAYCDLAVRRWERETGQEARLIETGETFADLARRREAEQGQESHERTSAPSVSGEVLR